MADNVDTCYKGQSLQKWQEAVTKINECLQSLLPKILVKGPEGNYTKVHPSYPKLEGYDKKQVTSFLEAYSFINKEDADGHIDHELKKDYENENKSLESMEDLRYLIPIIEQRVKVAITFDRLNNELEEIKAFECDLDVQIILRDYKRGDQDKKEELENKIIDRVKAYRKVKANIERLLKIFQTSSKDLATKEGQNFDENFNPNEYLNYIHFINNYMIDDQSIEEYFKDQEKEWTNLMKDLNSHDPSEVKKNAVDAPVQKVQESIENKLNKKMKKLIDFCAEAECVLTEANVKELELNIKKIQKVQEELIDYKYESDILMSKENKSSLERSKKIIRDMLSKVDEIQNKRATDSEKRKQEIQSNIRSMESIKLLHLNGAEDFIAWKKSQLNLNTHTDPFKKAAALLATLKNPEDIQMCKGIYNYEILMEKLDNKYNHQDKIMSALRNKLEKLPFANTTQTLLKNIRLILNVYQQFLDIGAESNFDSTLIISIKKKFNDSTKLEYEKFVKDHKYKSQLKEMVEHGSNDTSKSRDSPSYNSLKIANNSKEIRNNFLAFIREQEDAIEKAGISQETHTSEGKKCPKCKKTQKYCNCGKAYKERGSVHNVEANKECICCQSKDPHKTNYGKITSSLGRCPKFQGMNYEDKRKFANKSKACYVCLVPGHNQEECRIKNNCINCKKSRHHHLLCPEQNRQKKDEESSKSTGHINFAKSKSGENRFVIVPVKIKVNLDGNSKYIITHALFDSGASINLGKKKILEETGLRGKNETLTLHKSGDISAIQSKLYTIELIDNENKLHSIEVYSQDKAPGYNTKMEKHQLEKMAELFNVPSNQINNCEGEIGLILGIEHFNISPMSHIVKQNEKCTLFKSKFGRPYVLGGKIPGTPDQEIKPKEIFYIDLKRQQSYWEGDQLGLNTDPKCSTCIKAGPCKQCLLLNQPLSYKEQEEGKMIKNSMTFDLEKGEIHVSYPHLKNIDEIFPPGKTNKSLAEKMAKNLKKSLIRDNLLDRYTEEFMAMEDRGAIRELSQEEMQEWESKGNPINYASHHAVNKESKSTPCRSVCNSSLPHNNTSLNELMPKGPTALSNLLHVFLRFRENPYVVICDLKKAYNTIKTSEKDCHLRRLMWYRNDDLKDPQPKLRTFGMLTVAFGDRPAQYILECSKEEVSNYARDVMKDEKLANDILTKSYVDDTAISLEKLSEAESYKEKLPKAYESYGFKIKEIFVGGRDVIQDVKKENQLLFGHEYDPNEDKILLKFTVNFSTKKRSQRTEANLTMESDLTKLEMTKRKVLSLMSSQYDPMGLASPFLAKIKQLYARLHKYPEYEKDNWDVKLNEELQKKAIALVKQMIFASENSPTFKRSFKPEGYKIKRLVVFVDASTISLQVVVYALYTSSKKEAVTSLITAKNKITQLTVPRNELQSLVAGHRLVLNCLEALEEPIKEVCFLSDSTAVLDSLKSSYVSRDIFVINRISEMRRAVHKMNCNVKYYHLESKLNIADKGTREDCNFEYLSSKEWQEGPPFIKKDLDDTAELKLEIKKTLQYMKLI